MLFGPPHGGFTAVIQGIRSGNLVVAVVVIVVAAVVVLFLIMKNHSINIESRTTSVLQPTNIRRKNVR